MDSNHQEQSTSHHEEAPLDLQNDDLLGVGRLYGCGFCKRGFDTAQALGGHMNIHRSMRDHRAAKKNPVSTNPTHKPPGKLCLDFVSRDDCASRPSSSLPTECFPASMSPGSNISSLGIHFLSDHSPVGHEDYDTGLALGSGYGSGLSVGKRKEVEKVGRCEKEDVDLELRLGL